MNPADKKAIQQNMKIGLLLGGFGGEREGSFESGENMYENLIKDQFNVVKIDPQENLIEKLNKEKPDVLLNFLHGAFGEDGKVQAILEYLRIPFVCEDPLSSGIAKHKIRAKEILKSYNIPTAPYFNFYHYLPNAIPSPHEIFEEIIESGLKTPFFFKDAFGGSSIGIWKINCVEDLVRIMPTCDFAQHPGQYFVEEGVNGREISVGVYRSPSGVIILPIVEIDAGDDFFSYDAKFADTKTQIIIPAHLSEKVQARIHSVVTKIYNIMQFRACVRIDFILDEAAELEPIMLEINNQPGMTKHSFIPMMLKAEGIPLTDFLAEQISLVKTYPKPNF